MDWLASGRHMHAKLARKRQIFLIKMCAPKLFIVPRSASFRRAQRMRLSSSHNQPNHSKLLIIFYEENCLHCTWVRVCDSLRTTSCRLQTANTEFFFSCFCARLAKRVVEKRFRTKKPFDERERPLTLANSETVCRRFETWMEKWRKMPVLHI